MIQTAFDHFERGHLLGHKQHPLSFGYCCRDDVGNGLGLARSRRPLHQDVVALEHVVHDQGLRRIAVNDMAHLLGRDDAVQIDRLIRETCTREAILNDAPKRRDGLDPAQSLPALGV